MKKYFYVLFLACLILSCDQRTKDHEEYEITSLLYDYLTKRIPIPPPFMGDVAQKDSLRIMTTYKKLKDSLTSVKQIVAVHPSMKPVNLDPGNFRDNQKELVIQLNSLKEIKPLDVEKVSTLKNDSVIRFENEHLRKHSADYIGINRLISFSRIAFNSSRTEAVLVATTGTSRLDTHTAIYFLKKLEGEWVLKNSKTLSIS